MLLSIHAKNWKYSMHQFFIKIGKPQFGPISGHFSPKNFKTTFCLKKTLKSIVSLYATVIPYQNSEKFHAFSFNKT